MMNYTGAELTAILGSIGALIAALSAGIVQVYRTGAEVRAQTVVMSAQLQEAVADIAQLKHERDQLRQTLDAQIKALTQQSERLTYTINQLAAMTLERDQLVTQVRTLVEENDALKREKVMLERRIADLEARVL